MRSQRRENRAGRRSCLGIHGAAAGRSQDRRLLCADNFDSVDGNFRPSQLAELPRTVAVDGRAAAGPDERCETIERGDERQPPLVKAASLLAWPDHAPVGLAATM